MSYSIGIDLGGTTVKFALVSADGEIVVSDLLPSCATVSAEAVIGQLATAIKRMLAEARERHLTVAGVGIGTPGITDATGRIVIGGAENIAGWENLPLADRLEKIAGLPVRIDNDANLMGLGEQAYGAARGCSDALFITVGTGIGGAIIIDGKLFRGYAARGTELGHFPFMADGEPCACGAVGCWEHYASTTALVREYGENADGKTIVARYLQGEAKAKEMVERHCRYVGQGIAGLVNIFSPQKVVIGGGISEAGDFYLRLVQQYFNRYVMAPCAENTEICLARLGNKAGLLGAANLVL